MDRLFPDPAGLGLIIIVIWIALVVVGFVVSAFITSLFLRLVIRFSRRALDREYRYMRDANANATSYPDFKIPQGW